MLALGDLHLGLEDVALWTGFCGGVASRALLWRWLAPREWVLRWFEMVVEMWISAGGGRSEGYMCEEVGAGDRGSAWRGVWYWVRWMDGWMDGWMDEGKCDVRNVCMRLVLVRVWFRTCHSRPRSPFRAPLRRGLAEVVLSILFPSAMVFRSAAPTLQYCYPGRGHSCRFQTYS